ncbi:MAG: tetratricopeptide repeat protein [Planctomycetia bacterium]|nr:MAG: tetratricopeptide repeat protein [Planctomycetia bacterium]
MADASRQTPGSVRTLVRTRQRGLRFAGAAHAAPAIDPLALRIVAEPELITAMAETLRPDDAAAAGQLWAAVQAAVSERSVQPELLLHAARFARRSGRQQQAATWLQDALALSPRDLDALILYGQVATELSRPQEGAAALERAIALGADYPDVHLRLGDALRAEGRRRAAAQAYRRALQLNERLTAAREALRAIVEEEGKGATHELPA